jgi:hypothetical protein
MDLRKRKRQTDLILMQRAIEKWQDVARDELYDNGARNCALCSTYLHRHLCIGCPIHDDTNCVCCNGTPYEDWVNHQEQVHNAVHNLSIQCSECRELADAEVAYLKKLRDKLQNELDKLGGEENEI